MENKLNKPPLLFSTARSGSTPVYNAISIYLYQTAGIVRASELFNIYAPSILDRTEQSFVKISRNKFEEVLQPIDKLSDEQIRITNRRALIEKLLRGKIFFKVFPFQPLEEHWPTLINEYEFIFLERRNTFDQLLSYLISFETGEFYNKNGITWEESSIKARFLYFEWFCGMIEFYRSMKATLKPEKVIFLEDFLKDGAEVYLKKIGFDQKFDPKLIPVGEKQNTKPKDLAFSNYKEIVTWYKNSSIYSGENI